MSAPWAWGTRSLARLGECHPLLSLLMHRVIKRSDLPFDLTILCGHRGKAEQDRAVATGASKLRWPRSKHNSMPSMAVDVAPYIEGKPSWDWDDYNELSPLIQDEWAQMVAEGLIPSGLSLEWGGDWRSLKDGVHWQLS